MMQLTLPVNCSVGLPETKETPSKGHTCSRFFMIQPHDERIPRKDVDMFLLSLVRCHLY